MPVKQAAVTAVKDVIAPIPVAVADSSDGVGKLYRVDFAHPEFCALGKPYSCAVYGNKLPLKSQSWANVLLAVTEFCIARDYPKLKKLYYNPLYEQSLFFLPRKLETRECMKLSNGYWICTNHNPAEIVTLIRLLCHHCGMYLTNVEILYSSTVWEDDKDKPQAMVAKPVVTKPKTEATIAATQVAKAADQELPSPFTPTRRNAFKTWLIQNHYAEAKAEEYCREVNRMLANGKLVDGFPLKAWQRYQTAVAPEAETALKTVTDTQEPEPAPTRTVPSKPVSPPEQTCTPMASPAAESASLDAAVTKLLQERFLSGVDIKLTFDLERFRRALPPEAHALSDDAVKTLLRRNGVLINGRICAIPEEAITFIREKAEAAFADRTSIVFFSAFFEQHRDDLAVFGLHNTDAFCSYFHKNFTTEYRILRNSEAFAKTTGASLAQDLEALFADGEPLSLPDIQTRLPYSDPELVKQILREDDRYISIGRNVWCPLSGFEISREEMDALRRQVHTLITEQGYCSVLDLDTEHLRDMNPQFEDGIYEAIYQKALRGLYNRRGKILQPLNSSLSAMDILERELWRRDEITVEELKALHAELLGVWNYQSLERAFEVMVRVNTNTFVARRRVRFDVEVIDRILDEMCGGLPTPLRHIVAFGAFPACGYPWSTELLSGYSRSVSRRYKLLYPVANTSNIGILCPRGRREAYEDLAAQLLARSGAALTPQSAGQWLKAEGIYGLSKPNPLEGIVQKARRIRAGGDR